MDLTYEDIAKGWTQWLVEITEKYSHVYLFSNKLRHYLLSSHHLRYKELRVVNVNVCLLFLLYNNVSVFATRYELSEDGLKKPLQQL